ncbi:replication-relaxation family protein [Kitasatospora sp. NPDC059571]|uniref:replication-relaxation family protein n=1 Tax=Kitasatospora sp. NPDC059571 TaxID=3346871 RepID=UPI003694CCD8
MSQDQDDPQHPDRPERSDGLPAAKTRTAFVRAKAYPNGSTGPLRHSVLQVLGVLKVATVKQTWLLAQPGHEQPNTVAGALRDLALNRLTEKRGTTSGIPAQPRTAHTADSDTAATDATGEAATGAGAKPLRPARRRPVRPVGAGAVIWGLTDLGLDAAKSTLPSGRKVGGRARSVGRTTGAPHAMAVNDTIVAITSPATPGEPIGTIADWTTEAPHPLPGDRAQYADAVLTAPADNVPLLLVEVDLHNETPEFIAAKFDRYAEYFALTYNDPTHDGHHSTARKLPLWRRTYPQAGPGSLPPIALVLGGAGPRGLNNLLNKVMDLTYRHWAPPRHDPLDFAGRIPILACHLDSLKQRGPYAPIWWRFGARQWQPLTDALAHTEYRARIQRPEVPQPAPRMNHPVSACILQP